MAFMNYLQGWIGVVGLTALGNTISCYRGSEFLAERLYTGAKPDVNDLMGRLFGTWTFLSAILRIYCAVCIENKGIYHMTMFSFALAFGHFLSEALLFKTVFLSEIGVMMPLIISSVSFTWMAIAYPKIFSNNTGKEKHISMDDVKNERRNIKKYL